MAPTVRHAADIARAHPHPPARDCPRSSSPSGARSPADLPTHRPAPPHFVQVRVFQALWYRGPPRGRRPNPPREIAQVLPARARPHRPSLPRRRSPWSPRWWVRPATRSLARAPRRMLRRVFASPVTEGSNGAPLHTDEGARGNHGEGPTALQERAEGEELLVARERRKSSPPPRGSGSPIGFRRHPSRGAPPAPQGAR
jgi:hypothetical protein